MSKEGGGEGGYVGVRTGGMTANAGQAWWLMIDASAHETSLMAIMRGPEEIMCKKAAQGVRFEATKSGRQVLTGW